MGVAAIKPVVKQAHKNSPIYEAALQELLVDIKNRREEFKKQRHISQDVIEKLQEIGVYGCLLYTSPSPRD